MNKIISTAIEKYLLYTGAILLTQLASLIFAIYNSKEIAIAVLGFSIAITVLIWTWGKNAVKQLNIVGIDTVYMKFVDAPTALEMIMNAKNSVDYFGISGRTFLESNGIIHEIQRKISTNVRFRFLLLSPTSKFLELKALDEGDTPEAWVHDIESTLSRFSTFKQETKPDSAIIRIFDSLPIWRIVIIDKSTCYVSNYPHAKRGKESLVIKLNNINGETYNAFADYFEHIWSDVSKDYEI